MSRRQEESLSGAEQPALWSQASTPPDQQAKDVVSPPIGSHGDDSPRHLSDTRSGWRSLRISPRRGTVQDKSDPLLQDGQVSVGYFRQEIAEARIATRKDTLSFCGRKLNLLNHNADLSVRLSLRSETNPPQQIKISLNLPSFAEVIYALSWDRFGRIITLSHSGRINRAGSHDSGSGPTNKDGRGLRPPVTTNVSAQWLRCRGRLLPLRKYSGCAVR